MTATGPTFADIKIALEDKIESLVRELVPDGHKNGKYWIGKNPTRADRHGGSFWVLIGRNPGVWRDEATGDGGDVISLVQYVGQLPDYSATRSWCLKWLGWSNGPVAPMSDAARRADEAHRAKIRAEQDAADQAEREKQSRRAFALWLKAERLEPKDFPGSIVDRYLQGRGIDLVTHRIAAGLELPGAIRIFPAHDYVLAEGEGRIALPCMITLMSDAAGKAQAVHRTWLKPDGSGKADLPDPKKNKPRKIWPGPKGAVMRIAKGETGLSPEQADRKGKRGPLVITEGVEDALSVAIGCPEMRVWAAGTLGNIGNAPMLACVTDVTVCADNDWHNPQAARDLKASIDALKAQGRSVRKARSPIGKDFNDLLKGETVK